MNKSLKTIIGCFFVACAITACTGNEEIRMPEDCGAERTQLQFVMHKQLPDGITRTEQTTAGDNNYTTEFSDGDEVGIFVYDASSGVVDTNEPIGANVRYAYDATSRTWNPVDGEPISLPRNWEAVNVYAYYPAVTATDVVYTAISHSIRSAQSGADNYAQSDFLVASLQLKAEDASTLITMGADEAPKETATLVFKHVCALLEVTVDGRAVADYKGVQPTVTLLSAKSDMLVDLSADRSAADFTGFTVSESKTVNIAMLPVESANATDATEWKFCAVVPQQVIALGAKLLEITFRPAVPVVGMVYSYQLPTGKTLSLSAGKLRKVKVTISAATPSGSDAKSEAMIAQTSE